MSRLLALSASRELRKWCLYALVLLAPGSFVILPVVWCVRRFRDSVDAKGNVYGGEMGPRELAKHVTSR
jgi:hypothetical protein